MNITQKALCANVRALGMTCKPDECGEYRVAFCGKVADTEPSAYYTPDRDDAWATATSMQAHPTCPLAAQARAIVALRAEFAAARRAWINDDEPGVPQPTKAWARFVRAAAALPTP